MNLTRLLLTFLVPITCLANIGVGPTLHVVSFNGLAPQASPTLRVRVEGIRSSEGTIRLGFYDSEAQWKTEKSSFQRAAPKSGLVNGTLEFVITDVSPGEYSVAIADDENDNGEMDWGWILPKEGFGFSNYELKGIRRPRFDDFKFDFLPEGETLIIIKVKYL